MSSIENIKENISIIESQASDASAYLSDIEQAVEYWDQIEGEGWCDADGVLNALESVAELLELKEDLSDMHPDDIRSCVTNWQETCAYFAEQGYEVSDSEEAKEAIESLPSLAGASEVVAAIQMLIGALHRAGVLGGPDSNLGIVKIGEPKPAFEEPEEPKPKHGYRVETVDEPPVTPEEV